MELYKTEKINPMGGLSAHPDPDPVFIALYWVLLGTVEMRQAPFMLWIQDLSAADPYYVLPVLMGITMIIQTRLNPTPPDPIRPWIGLLDHAAVRVQTWCFFFFPAGLLQIMHTSSRERDPLANTKQLRAPLSSLSSPSYSWFLVSIS